MTVPSYPPKPTSTAVVFHQTVESVGHMVVADIPRLRAAVDHRPVVRIGPGQHLGVLPEGELRQIAVVRPRLSRPRRPRRFLRLSAQPYEQREDLRLAAGRDQLGGTGVRLRVLGIRFEAAVRLQRRFDLAGVVGVGVGVGRWSSTACSDSHRK